jgi:rubrerythrin
MAFDPLDQPGIPVEQQFQSLEDMNPDPYDKRTVDPYTRTRVILMNGIEVEAIMFSHQFARHTDNPELLRNLAVGRRVDQMQQKIVNGLNPGDQSTLETTIGYEQVAVDLTAWLARHEPDPYLKQALDFALLEDFDHLYRYANLYDLLEGKKAHELTGHLTEIMPGRPTMVEHRHPIDDLNCHYATQTVHPLSRMHVMTIVAAEQQTMNFYMNHATDYMEPIVRGLYNEIAMIEEQHVTHYESLLDPLDSWLKMWVFHEYNEIYMYWSMLQQEGDRRIKAIWEQHCDMEIGQLQVACEMLEKYEGIDPREILPRELPDTPVTFEPNKEYVRDVLATQVDLRKNGFDYVPLTALDSSHPYFEMQDVLQTVNAPSERVIDEARRTRGAEYRDETEGEHPVTDLRETATSR